MVPARRVGAVLLALTLVASTALLGLGASTPAVAQSSQASGPVTLTTVNDTVRVHPTSGATIEGTADLPAGSELQLRLKSTGDTEPRFFKTKTVTVGEDGRFAATFDFSGHGPGATFEVTVRHNGSTVLTGKGLVVRSDVAVAPSASGGETDASTEGTTTSGPGFGVVAVLAALGLALAVGLRARSGE